MTAGAVAAIVAVVVVVATVAWFLLARKHPENATRDATGERGGREFFGDPNDRPGGPGSEADAVPERGAPAPGPSAESLPPDTNGGPDVRE